MLFIPFGWRESKGLSFSLLLITLCFVLVNNHKTQARIKIGFQICNVRFIAPQELELFDGGCCPARKGTSTTVPVMASPTIMVSPSETDCLLI